MAKYGCFLGVFLGFFCQIQAILKNGRENVFAILEKSLPHNGKQIFADAIRRTKTAETAWETTERRGNGGKWRDAARDGEGEQDSDSGAARDGGEVVEKVGAAAEASWKRQGGAGQ